MNLDPWSNWPPKPPPPQIKRRPIPNAPTGSGEFEPAGGTKFSKGDYVRINRFGPNDRRYAQVIRIRAQVNGTNHVRYVVATIDNARRVVIDLSTGELVSVHLNAMEILALQARPDPPSEG